MLFREWTSFLAWPRPSTCGLMGNKSAVGGCLYIISSPLPPSSSPSFSLSDTLSFLLNTCKGEIVKTDLYKERACITSATRETQLALQALASACPSPGWRLLQWKQRGMEDLSLCLGNLQIKWKENVFLKIQRLIKQKNAFFLLKKTRHYVTDSHFIESIFLMSYLFGNDLIQIIFLVGGRNSFPQFT